MKSVTVELAKLGHALSLAEAKITIAEAKKVKVLRKLGSLAIYHDLPCVREVVWAKRAPCDLVNGFRISADSPMAAHLKAMKLARGAK